jgi:chaperone required for assembly of F1-ATPase
MRDYIGGMREDLANQMLPGQGEAIDPVAMARRDQQKALPRRFYQDAAAEPRGEGFAVCLDGKLAHTPGRRPIEVPGRELADALAAEWQGQGELIDPAAMPLTRLVNSALDGVAQDMASVRAEIVKYAGSDLLCYRAGEPATLVELQSQVWDPLLTWARDEWGARFVCAEGVMFAEQPAASLAAIERVVAEVSSPLALAALNVMTTITGSALLALAVAQGRLDAAQAWQAAHVDEDHQMRTWGEDAEALARRARRWTEMESAARLFALVA